MDQFIAKLKEWLSDNKAEFFSENPWCGDTESGFYTETEFDFDSLLNEIDKFSESFKKEGK